MMPTVSRSLRAVEVLSDVDPVFQELCGVLYGPDVDPEAIWEDVFKASPDSADVHQPGSGQQPSLKRRLAFASTVAGGVLGARELAGQVPKLTRAVRAGKGVLVPAERATGRGAGVKNAFNSPAGRVGTAALATGGDVIAGDELNPNKKQKQDVAKGPSVGEMASGIQSKLKRLMPAARDVHPQPAQPLGAARQGGDPAVASAYSSGQRPTPAAPGQQPSAAVPHPGAPDPAQVPGTPPAAGPAQAGPPGVAPQPGAPAPGVGPAPSTAPPPHPGAQAGPAPVGGATPQGAPQPGAPTGQPTPATPSVQPGAPGSESHANGQAVGQLIGSATATPGRKVLVGGAVAAAALRARSNQQQGQQQQDPYAAYYGKRDSGPDFTATVRFAKFDDDQRLAYGWASVTKLNGRPVLDRQGDYIDAADLEDAAVDFMQRSRKGGHMHRRDEYDLPVHVSDIVESVVFTDEKVTKMGLPENFPRGWWIGVKVHDPDVWEDVKKGGLGGFSIHGRGKRTPLNPYEMAGAF
jgi:hypothetical protein